MNSETVEELGRDVLSYATECKHLSEGLGTFYHH